ncbi:hypothetical protein ORI20_32660 [Mycobacterium sp. CVI_P3]|uniref:Formate acetyltransferase n=1 Tax=Mycobacterium pinniadriaticum TaxID=2994102 RepID=A0ABT3SPJ1_9MYCO|nr:pyruvate formate lyase family protein [Mycobacterium pinniadriaticum]MCX2935012.1 hypothetical protein [Mycobacterium pinniadriaticum]MCX2941435.1 hypothetical protein [Mycobacterium pinniadriaticum]
MKNFNKTVGNGSLDAEYEDAEALLFATLQNIEHALNTEPALNREMTGAFGPIDAVVGIRTEDDTVQCTIEIRNAECTVVKGVCRPDAGATLVFDSLQEFASYVNADHDEAIRMFLASRVRLEGNPAAFGYVSYLTSLLSRNEDVESYRKQIERHRQQAVESAEQAGEPQRGMQRSRIKGRLRAEKVDPGVKYLEEPFLSQYVLEDFPRLARFRQEHYDTMPEVTAEQGRLLTDFYVINGFETKSDGTAWDPTLRTARAFEYLMENKEPVLRKDGLLAGTITPNPICGSVQQPYTVGWSIWGEMTTLQDRELDPFFISDETRETLHRYVFPFWMDKHTVQMWKDRNDYPLSAKINDRMFCFNLWSLNSLNPGSPGFERVVHQGLESIREEVVQQRAAHVDTSPDDVDQNKMNTWEAMLAAIDGVLAYTRNLAAMIRTAADDEADPTRRQELETIHANLLRVPRYPAQTLHEAVQALWIMFIALSLDSMDDDITVGRLDQILQPYFAADIEKIPNDEREAYVKRAIELVGCLFLRFTSHRIAAATIASWQNSGAPGVASVTVGGVTPEGKDGVNDMTYIVLKVAEMLSLDDPDMDARYMVGVNSTDYIRRVAELNYITSGTPSIHNDEAIIDALCQHGWKVEDARDWVPCGCVEPVIHGKHFAATGDVDSNLMVPLTMAMYNGYHPTARWDFGPKTGELEAFETFDDFFEAFETQFKFIYREAIEASHQILRVHQQIMPAPLYSVTLQGCVESGVGMTHGGARYNSSGAAFIALSDVTDSLLTIKQVVFDEEKYTLREIRDAMDANFEGHEAMHAYIMNRVPKFGSGDPRGRAMVDRVTRMTADFLHGQDNGRGGHYSTGYRTNNNHTVYGRVSGASPSGRLAGTPFTSGLTPNPAASKNPLDNFNDVASIDPLTCDNNYTLNVRLSFSNKDSHKQNVDHIASYVQAYFVNGGMQVQFNMVDGDTLRDAMAHPEFYPDLIVRVSGYTGYYTRMQRDLQLEIIGRTEFVI